MLIQAIFYMGLYSARKRHSQGRDLTLATGVSGVCYLAAGLMGMRYAESLGIAAPGTFDRNYLRFGVLMLVATLLGVGLVSLLRRTAR